MNKNIDKNYLPKFIWFLVLIFVAGSCRLAERNVNPTASTDAPVGAVLSGAQGSLAFSLGADANPITAIFVQQLAGSNGDATAYENYVESSGRYDQLWGDIFPGAINNLAIVKRKALQSNSPYYVGIARVLLALSFGTLTDIFGDIPYFQALQGRGNTAPAYDSQQAIYKDIQIQLDSAIQELSIAPSSFSTPAPGTDDIIYGGSTAKWIAAAWTLKARYAIHLTKIDPSAAARALEYAQKGIQNNGADFQINFGSSATNSNPYAQFQTFRRGWVSLSASFVNLLNGNLPTDAPTKTPSVPIDPRRAAFATPASGNHYTGFRLGVSTGPASIGPYFATATAPVIFATHAENNFIQAEALLRTDPSNLTKIQTILNEAINASFDKVALASDTHATVAKRAAYIAAKATLSGDFEKDLNTIITQKYIALFTQGEAWVDYRRTGYPTLPLVQGGNHNTNPGGEIPRRALYPSNEQLLNPNSINTGANHQQPRLWWDKQ